MAEEYVRIEMTTGEKGLSMTENEIRNTMEEDKSISFADIFPYEKNVQGKVFFKAPWPERIVGHGIGENIIYITDVKTGGIDKAVYRKDPSPDDVYDIMQHSYTIRDFLDTAYGNLELAKDLYNVCEGQMPDIGDIRKHVDNKTAMAKYGETWDDMKNRLAMINQVRHEIYRLYQYDWFMLRGYSIEDIVRHAAEASNELVNEKKAHTTEDIVSRFEGNGLVYGGLYDDFDQFIKYSYDYKDSGYSYCSQSYVKELISRSPYDGDCYDGHDLAYWYSIDVNGLLRLDHNMEETGPHLISNFI